MTGRFFTKVLLPFAPATPAQRHLLIDEKLVDVSERSTGLVADLPYGDAGIALVCGGHFLGEFLPVGGTEPLVLRDAGEVQLRGQHVSFERVMVDQPERDSGRGKSSIDAGYGHRAAVYVAGERKIRQAAGPRRS